jgi:hypothetical protein
MEVEGRELWFTRFYIFVNEAYLYSLSHVVDL